MKKVGAHRPMKIPNRSACAFESASVPPVRNHTAIDVMIEAKPKTKQALLSSEWLLLSIVTRVTPMNQNKTAEKVKICFVSTT